MSADAWVPVLTYTPSQTGAYNVLVSLVVTGAPTAVQAYVQWTGPNGSPRTLWLAGRNGAWTLAPDDYSFLPASLTSLGGEPITVYVWAGTANQVEVSGAIWAEV